MIQPPILNPNPPEAPSGTPIHPLAAGVLVAVDNLWNLADWVVVTWWVTVPLSFLSVFVPTLWFQRRLRKDRWGSAVAKALALGLVAAIPTSLTGTPVGMALLAWAGVDRWRR
ncbi:MAG: hypothetical protein RLZZ582_107 [Verrucomicrobiota bacterium]